MPDDKQIHGTEEVRENRQDEKRNGVPHHRVSILLEIWNGPDGAAEMPAQHTERPDDAHAGSRPLSDEIAGKRTERHEHEHEDETERSGKHIEENCRRIQLQPLDGARENRRDGRQDADGDNQHPEAPDGDAHPREEKRQADIGEQERQQRKASCANEDIPHKRLYLPVFPSRAIVQKKLRERRRHDRQRDANEGYELREGQHRAQLALRHVLRHEPKPNEHVDHIAYALGGEEKERVPPEVAEARTAFPHQAYREHKATPFFR